MILDHNINDNSNLIMKITRMISNHIECYIQGNNIQRVNRVDLKEKNEYFF